MTVWDDVVGQPDALAVLAKAVADPTAMTHAWLFTGPPGSGRSVAARAFAAPCSARTAGAGMPRVPDRARRDADVTVVATEGLSIKVDSMRALVQEAAFGRRSVGGGS